MIKGTILTPPPCTINNNNPIDVDFGSAVDISKVDGKNYLTPVSYTLQCTGATSNIMKLSIQGTAAEFDDGAALDAGHGGLGIELQQDGQKLTLGKAVNFIWPDYPALQAVPIKKAGAKLETGTFSVGATMVVDWQ
ncbi:fimbrial protein [Pantoea sp. SIMBA_072]